MWWRRSREAGRGRRILRRSHAVLHHETEVAEFEAGGGKPARMWQEASQVEAATIVVDRKKKTLVAKPAAGGVVRSVFVESAAAVAKHAGQPGGGAGAPNIVAGREPGIGLLRCGA